MAVKKKQKSAQPKQNEFAEIILKIAYRFSQSKVFDDFLTMAIAACTRNPATGLSHYEEEYLQTIAAYKDSELRFDFANAFAALVIEMEARIHDHSLGNDILGEFFEQHISNGRNGQYFTPFPLCQFMASATTAKDTEETEKPLRILDPACGSGRMLLAAYKQHGRGNEYFGIDIDRICVKMTAINLFLNGVWNSEVMCANFLAPDDFVIAYHISSFPLGIFKIEQKENCKLWHLHRNSFTQNPKKSVEKKTDFVFTNKNVDPHGTQMDLFSQ